MKTFLITYDLNNPGQNYQTLLKIMSQAFRSYTKISDSSYALSPKADLTAKQIFDMFKMALDSNDVFYVFELDKNFAFQGNKDAAGWLTINLA